jgi:hypothetical protein
MSTYAPGVPLQDTPAAACRHRAVKRGTARLGVKRAAIIGVLLLITALPGGAKKGREISGLIETRDFVIPAGQTIIAVQDTMILASHRIAIYGTLIADPGVEVTFKSPSVSVEGHVRHLPSLAGRVQIAEASVNSFWQSLWETQPPVPEKWPGRGEFGCNIFSRQSLAQSASKAKPAPASY